jgi:hypothetical protein
MLAAAAFSSLIALRSIHVEELETDVPVAAQIWLADAKHTFRDLAAEHVDEDFACIEERLRLELAMEGIPLDCEECSYGSVNKLQVSKQDDVTAVEVGLSIPYDTDSALYLYRNGRLVYQREVNDYESIGDALGSFQWKLSRPGADGSRLILTTAISPSPASNWQMLTYTVDRILPDCDQPIPIVREETEIFLGWDELALHVEPDHYGLRFAAGGLEGGFTRTRVLEYELDGDEPVRVEPIADTPEDFLQEWLKMPAEEAMQWSDVELTMPDGDRSWGPVRQCVDGAWQLRVDVMADADSDEYEPVYFIVDDKKFRVREIRDEPRPGCPDEFPPQEGSPQ